MLFQVPPFKDPPEMISVHEMPMSARLASILDRLHITTVSELCLNTRTELLRIRGIGRKTISEIERLLKELGAELKDDSLSSPRVV